MPSAGATIIKAEADRGQGRIFKLETEKGPNDMTTERLVSAHKAAPFRPFTIRMVDGRSHRIAHPELFAYKPGTRSAVALGPKGEVEILDTMLICGITIEDIDAGTHI
jgi:hypothetical protein